MSNDIDVFHNGDLAPYQPGTGLQPFSPQDDWGNTDVDYLSERPTSQPLQDPQIEQNFQAIATTFTTDMASLGFVQRDIDLCINWFRQSLTNPPTRMPQKNHSYNLWQYSNDPAMNHFAIYAQQHKLSQNMIQSICYWCQQLEDLQNGVGRFAGQKVHTPNTSSDPTDSLSDADYNRVVQINEQAQAQTRGYLSDLWGSSYAANMRVTNQYFQNLPTADQEFLGQYAQNWVKGTNSVDVLLGLYKQAIGSGTLPKSGAEISREIASIENVMRTERSKYMKDDQLQARYRELLRMRGY